MTKDTLTVRVTLIVEVDRDDYELNYGTRNADTIRSDVKDAVVDTVNSGGVFASGIVSARLVR